MPLPSRAQAWEGLGLGAWAGGSVWKESRDGWRHFMACHLQPIGYLKILVHARCHWWWLVAASFWIVATPKLPSALHHECVLLFFCTRRLSVQPVNNYIFPEFLHSHDHQHPDRLQVFTEEVPRAKARQQLREAQNNDASRGLSEEGWLWGGKIQNPPKPLIQVLHPSVAK